MKRTVCALLTGIFCFCLFGCSPFFPDETDITLSFSVDKPEIALGEAVTSTAKACNLSGKAIYLIGNGKDIESVIILHFYDSDGNPDSLDTMPAANGVWYPGQIEKSYSYTPLKSGRYKAIAMVLFSVQGRIYEIDAAPIYIEVKNAPTEN